MEHCVFIYIKNEKKSDTFLGCLERRLERRLRKSPRSWRGKKKKRKK
jgi:hypothetical protein